MSSKWTQKRTVLPLPIYYNVSDAVPTLAPFLRGGAGFIGPVNYPARDQINAARLTSDVTKVYVMAY